MRKIYLFLFIFITAFFRSQDADAQYFITSITPSPDSLCQGFVTYEVKTNVYTLGQQVEVSWGNAWVFNYNVAQWYPNNIGHAMCQGQYTTVGTYTIKFVLINNNIRVDSSYKTFTYNGCQQISIMSFNDLNANCVYDIGDIPNYFPLTIEIDSNNVILDTVSACGFYFMHQGPVGTIYKYKVIATPPGLTVSCPLNGIILDTVFATNQYVAKTLAINCAAVPAYDLAAHISMGVKPTWAYIHLNLTNTNCNGSNATLIANMSPKTPFLMSYPAPTSVVGNTVTWNFNVAAIIPQYVTIWCDTPFVPALPVGDTVHTSFYLTPTVGDTNVSNNTIIRIDTVKLGWDPNFKNVSPQGDIPAGTELEYTIHFENTGNDTATNIHIMDTLSDNLLPNTFDLVSTTAEVYTQVVKYGANHYLLKFDFPNIKLPDSSHHGLCDGMVVYKIKTKSSLSPGTYIPNDAGIYFDANPVVMTNIVVNKIPSPDNVSVIVPGNNVSLYPNPATDMLTISMGANSYNSLEVNNTIGQVLIKQSVTQADTKVNVKNLPSGIYTITLKGDAGTKTLKFEKL